MKLSCVDMKRPALVLLYSLQHLPKFSLPRNSRGHRNIPSPRGFLRSPTPHWVEASHPTAQWLSQMGLGLGLGVVPHAMEGLC